MNGILRNNIIFYNLVRKTKNKFKVFYFENFKNTFYDFHTINSDKIVLHHHQGLGDAIICNGLVNYLAMNHFEKIILPVRKNIFNNLEFLYSNNPKVTLSEVSEESEIYSKFKELPILRVGFEKNYGKFNSSFYQQLKIPFKKSFELFNPPIDEVKEKLLLNHLFKEYKVTSNYILVHNTSSYGVVDLEFNTELPIIYIDKDTDIFNNVFYYSLAIKQATEIHCIDSSILHLVERIDTKAKLFFYPFKNSEQKSEKLELQKNWNII